MSMTFQDFQTQFESHLVEYYIYSTLYLNTEENDWLPWS